MPIVALASGEKAQEEDEGRHLFCLLPVTQQPGIMESPILS